ncbi:uncharacterized protein LOC132696985 [Cylas formicarius]|uniref:uncharacterized protein LOC132696985 n=1 Tax=Cylas formicarius TaxID=197179 RepID=UPI0029586A07|nr:uncharacterized protein LOC132696985 [Cylas formicarius]
MRIYREDGSFVENLEDVEFGWFLTNIAIDEGIPGSDQHNENLRKRSRLGPLEETVEEVGEEAIIQRLGPSSEAPSMDIKIQTASEAIDYEMNAEGFIECHDPAPVNLKVPSKEELMNLINPINTEAKALLSVLSYSKYKSLNEKITSNEVFKTLNFRTTNSKHLINENGGCITRPEFSFMLNDESADEAEEMYQEIRNYHARKENNMLSLMVDLIVTDMDSEVGEMTELNNSINEMNGHGTNGAETSDLGNSIHSSLSCKANRREKCNYLEFPNRSDILSSIGLSDDIDRSLQTFSQEKSEMHLQIGSIRESFEEYEKRVNELILQANAFQKDLRETAYLDNLINLLNGNPEAVKNKKWPFQIFRKSIEPIVDDNFIV